MKKGKMERMAGCMLGLACMAGLLLVMSGCAGMKGSSGGEQTGLREGSVQKYGYKGEKDELFVDVPVINPSTVRNGAQIIQTVQFAALSPDPGKRFLVQEVVTLSGKDIIIELSRKMAEKEQGPQVSTVQFAIPKDLPHGKYQLITVITTAGTSKKVTASFTVK